MTTLEQALNTVSQLSLEEQEMLLEIIKNRLIETRRQEIALDAKKSIEAFQLEKLKPQPVEEIISELRQTLEEN